MFSNISSINFNTNQPISSSATSATSSENISIFGNDLIKDKEDKPKLTKEEKQALKEQAKAERQRIRTTPDGIIQGGKQGSSAGDCWLLAQMNSMAKTDWGKDALKNAITQDKDGNFTVHFKGVNKDITISAKEFKKAQNNSTYSSGDADALLLEVATEKYFEETNLNSGTINGNDLAGKDSLQYLLTGTKGHQTNSEDDYKSILLTMGKYPEDNAGFATTYIYTDNTGATPTDHAVSVQQVILNEKGDDIKEVVLLDSYRPDTPFKKSYGQFVRDLQAIGITKVTNKSNELGNVGQKSE